MSVILDTRDVPRAERAGVISEVVRYTSAPCDVTHGPGGSAWARITYVELGGGASVYNHAGSGLSMRRRSRHLRVDDRQRLGLAIHRSVAGGVVLGDEERRLERQELVLVDVTSPYEYFWSGVGGADCVQLDFEVLGVSPGLVHAASGRLRASPLYELVRAHVHHVTRDADELADAAIAAASVGSATAHLIRALVTSAVGDGNEREAAMASVLKPRLLHWLRQHRADPFDIDRVAAAHDLSVARLRRAWSTMGMDVELEQWATSTSTQVTTSDVGMAGTRHPAPAAPPGAGAATHGASPRTPPGTAG